MDIRTFFNSEFSKLQTTNKNTLRQLEKTSEYINEQISEFEQLNFTLRSLLNRKPVNKKETTLKELTKSKNLQKKILSSVTSLISSTKKQPEILIKQKSEKADVNIKLLKLSTSSVRIDNAIFKNLTINGLNAKQKTSQSSEDFYRTDDSKNNFSSEKIKILTRINDKLAEGFSFNGDEKEEQDGGGFFGNINGIVSGILGGSVFSKLSKLLNLKAIFKGMLKTGAGAAKKALPVLGAVFSLYDLVKGVKKGITDYKAYSKQGDKLAAQGALSAMMMNTFGNTINIVGSFLPGPLGIALFGLGTAMTMAADTMAEKKGRTSGYVGEAREKTAKVEQLIDSEKEKGQFLEMRPNFKDYNNIFWEYKSGSSWKPIIDSSSGKNLSAMAGNNKIIPSTDPTKPGIQTYKLNTKTGIRELVMENGNVYMIVPNVGKVAVSTRKQGGSVVKNKTYLVGERQAESYVSSKDNKIKREIIQSKADSNKQFKKQTQKIDSTVEDFLKDLKAIRNSFSSGMSSSYSGGSTTTNPSQTPADATANIGSKIERGKVYKVANLPTIDKTKFGERYAKVKAPLKAASDKVGIPLETLVKFAHVESSLVSDAGAKTSSAKGLFQFVGGTWKGMVAKYGKEYGVSSDTSRTDSNANALMGALYIRENIKTLQRHKLDSNEQNLYLLHFLGPAGGPKLIKAAAKNPEAFAADILPNAAASNKPVFYNKDNTPKTIKEVYDWAGKKMSIDVSYMNSFSVGSWNIPNDQQAFVHKGETIVPEYYANKIRTAAKSGKMEIQKPTIVEEYDIYSDSNFWINTFMPALANVVINEFGGN